MRKIVNGKLYDTEIAKLITGWNKGEGYFYISECLYRTKKGAFFLECHGADSQSIEKQLAIMVGQMEVF